MRILILAMMVGLGASAYADTIKLNACINAVLTEAGRVPEGILVGGMTFPAGLPEGTQAAEPTALLRFNVESFMSENDGFEAIVVRDHTETRVNLLAPRVLDFSLMVQALGEDEDGKIACAELSNTPWSETCSGHPLNRERPPEQQVLYENWETSELFRPYLTGAVTGVVTSSDPLFVQALPGATKIFVAYADDQFEITECF
jgi:hypothetical protein